MKRNLVFLEVEVIRPFRNGKVTEHQTDILKNAIRVIVSPVAMYSEKRT
jgi:hypothetical protein